MTNQFTQKSQNEISLRMMDLWPEIEETLQYYADNSNYWDVSDGGKCHSATNIDQGVAAEKLLKKIYNDPNFSI